MSGNSAHIPFETLLDLAEERVPADERGPFASHLTECEACSADLHWITHTLMLMGTDEMDDAPVYVVARAVRAFQVTSVEAEQSESLPRRLLARLQFDSGARMTPAFGMRSAQTASRQLLFSTEGGDIDLRIAPVEDHWAVSGQLLGDCEPGTVELAGEQGRVSADLNDLCEFRLPPVTAGRYTLRLRFSGLELEVSDLEIGERSGTA